MAQDNGRPLLDTVAMAVMELDIKDRISSPEKNRAHGILSPEEIAERVAKNAYIMGLAMVQESLKMQKEWQLVPVGPPEEEETEE